jgi:hypothetical protein
VFGSWPNHDSNDPPSRLRLVLDVSGGVGDGTSDKVVSVALRSANEDER